MRNAILYVITSYAGNLVEKAAKCEAPVHSMDILLRNISTGSWSKIPAETGSTCAARAVPKADSFPVLLAAPTYVRLGKHPHSLMSSHACQSVSSVCHHLTQT